LAKEEEEAKWRKEEQVQGQRQGRQRSSKLQAGRTGSGLAARRRAKLVNDYRRRDDEARRGASKSAPNNDN